MEVSTNILTRGRREIGRSFKAHFGGMGNMPGGGIGTPGNIGNGEAPAAPGAGGMPGTP